MELYVRFGVTGTGSVDPHARHCRAVDGAQSLVSGTCPTQPWALGRWIVRLCHTVLFFWAQMQKKTASKLFLLKHHSVHFSVVALLFQHRDSLAKWVNGTCPCDLHVPLTLLYKISFFMSEAPAVAPGAIVIVALPV